MQRTREATAIQDQAASVPELTPPQAIPLLSNCHRHATARRRPANAGSAALALAVADLRVALAPAATDLQSTVTATP